jgi:hypothetical protein
MESTQPPIKQNIVISKTLPIPRQKSNFEKQLDSFKETLALQQAQLELFKTSLSECQHQTNKDHKHIKKLNKGFGGFIEDQGRTNREIKTNMASLDSKQLSNSELIKQLAESATYLQERVEILEQKNSIEYPQLSNIPTIIITPPTNEQKTVNQNLALPRQTTSNREETRERFKKIERSIVNLTEFANEQEEATSKLDTEHIRLNELITMLTEDSTKVEDRVENNEKLIKLLCQARGEVETEIITLKKTTSNLENKVNNNEEQISSLQRELITQGALHEIEVQEFKTTIEKQKQSINHLAMLALLWYYSKK